MRELLVLIFALDPKDKWVLKGILFALLVIFCISASSKESQLKPLVVVITDQGREYRLIFKAKKK